MSKSNGSMRNQITVPDGFTSYRISLTECRDRIFIGKHVASVDGKDSAGQRVRLSMYVTTAGVYVCVYEWWTVGDRLWHAMSYSYKEENEIYNFFIDRSPRLAKKLFRRAGLDDAIDVLS